MTNTEQQARELLAAQYPDNPTWARFILSDKISGNGDTNRALRAIKAALERTHNPEPSAHDGWTPVERADVPCRKCGVAGQIEYREWESSCGGFEDIHYRCNACNADWWIEGADA